MRARLVLLVAVSLLSAGCMGSSGDESPSANSTGDQDAPLPGPIHDEKRVSMAVAPLGSTQDEPCQTEASSCYKYSFHTGQDARLQARLDWANATNDFDLHVVDQEGEMVASSNQGVPGTQETIDTEIEAGSYELVVVAWAVQEDTYNLDAQFGYP